MTIPLPKVETTVDAIYQFHHNTQDGHRPHLGCSLIGGECDRKLWLTFRWASKNLFPGRIIRLFKRGQLEEPIFYSELKNIGCKVHAVDENGYQQRVSWHGGHFSGSVDGVVENVIEAPKTPHLLELKTINDRGYKELVKKGLEEARPVYWAQVHCYMKGLKLKRCLFLATNKNDDKIYQERVKYQAKVAQKYIDRAKSIITAATPPELLPPTDSSCKWCEWQEFCHGQQLPSANCRTCAHATPDIKDGGWRCERFDNTEIDLDVQRSGEDCPHHVFIPHLLENLYKMKDATEFTVTYENPENGFVFINGDPETVDGTVFRSKELAHINPKIMGDAQLMSAKEIFGGTVSGARHDGNDLQPHTPF